MILLKVTLIVIVIGIVHRDLKLENILIAGCEYSEHNDPLYDIRVSFVSWISQKIANAFCLLFKICIYFYLVRKF